MKKSEIDTLAGFLRHVELLVPLLPRCVDSSKHPLRVVNARRLLNKEIEKVRRIVDKLYENAGTENNASAG